LNEIRLRARLLARDAMRYTPAGVEVVQATLEFSGDVVEAGRERTLGFEFDAIVLGKAALRLAGEALGTRVEVSGFLAPRSKRSKRLRVHITDYWNISGD
jgi:primosomal replication protein N